MEEIHLENESFYNPSDVISLAEVELKKIIVLEKQKVHFYLTCNKTPLRIKVKATCGVIKRGLYRDKVISLQTKILNVLLCKVSNDI